MVYPCITPYTGSWGFNGTLRLGMGQTSETCEIQCHSSSCQLTIFALGGRRTSSWKKTRGYVLNHLPVWKDLFLLHDELKHLPRSLDVFRKVEGNPALSLQLPKPGVTAGRVLEHAAQVFTKLHDRNHPMTFKFGITMDAAVRWQYYDKCSKDRFDYMVIIYGASNPHGPAFLEAALIDRFQSFPVALCFSLHATSWRLQCFYLIHG